MRKAIACYVEVTIKSIKDAERFLNGFTGEAYIPCGGIDLCVEGYKDKHGNIQKNVSWRYTSERGDIFAPYIQSENGVKLLYQNRAYVNNWQKKGD